MAPPAILPPRRLQPGRVPHNVPLVGSGLWPPAGAILPVFPISVEAQPRNHEEDMPLSRIHRNPLSPTPFPVSEKPLGRHLVTQQTRMAQDIGRCSRAVIAPVIENCVPSSPLIGQTVNPVGGRNRTPDREGSVLGGHCPAIDQNRVAWLHPVGQSVSGLTPPEAGSETERHQNDEDYRRASHQAVSRKNSSSL